MATNALRALLVQTLAAVEVDAVPAQARGDKARSRRVVENAAVAQIGRRWSPDAYPVDRWLKTR